MATTHRLHILNQYPQFRTDAGIDAIINFINSNYTQFPNNVIHPRQQQRYIGKFGQNSGFRVENNNVLVYHPNNNPVARLIVSRVAERQQNMEEIFNDNNRGLALGLNAFYSQVARNFLNIKKQMTTEFLKTRGNYQVMRIPKKAINKPVIARANNERWQMDCIEMSGYPVEENNDYVHILTVVDVFSSKVWARPLPNKQNNAQRPIMRTAFQSICAEANTQPHILQMDNGTEFLGDLQNWVQQQGIIIARTKTYSPESNGKVERMNQTIRRKLKAIFLKNNNLVWQPFLQQVINNINVQKHSKTKTVPNDIWRPGYVPYNANIPVGNPLPVNAPLRVDNATLPQLHQYARQKIVNRAVRIVAENDARAKVYRVNDYVRINLLALNSETRKVKKNGIGWSKVGVRFTPEVYRVSHVIPPTPLEQRGYNLVRPGAVGTQVQGVVDQPLVARINGQRWKFYASQLTKVDFRGDRGPPLPPNLHENVNNANYLRNVNHSTLDPNTRFRAYWLNRTRPGPWDITNVTD